MPKPKKNDWLAKRLRGVRGDRDALAAKLAEDRALLDRMDECDGCDEYAAKFISDNMARVDKGFVMTNGQRAFARSTLLRLDG